jgi:hypothetical protein
MSLLARLSEPDFAKDPLVRPNARVFGAVLVAMNAFSCAIRIVSVVTMPAGGIQDIASPIEILVGTCVPQVLMIAGGLAMLRGDLRGKQLIVLSIPIGFVYVIAGAMATPPPIVVPVLVIELVPLMGAWLGLFYYLVVSSQLGPDPRAHRRAISGAVMGLAIVFVLWFGSEVLGALGVQVPQTPPATEPALAALGG